MTWCGRLPSSKSATGTISVSCQGKCGRGLKLTFLFFLLGAASASNEVPDESDGRRTCRYERDDGDDGFVGKGRHSEGCSHELTMTMCCVQCPKLALKKMYWDGVVFAWLAITTQHPYTSPRHLGSRIIFPSYATLSYPIAPYVRAFRSSDRLLMPLTVSGFATRPPGHSEWATNLQYAYRFCSVGCAGAGASFSTAHVHSPNSVLAFVGLASKPMVAGSAVGLGTGCFGQDAAYQVLLIGWMPNS
jgi:hypothetical protein